jgi:hypothetical protein
MRILSNYATKDEYYDLLTFNDDYDYLVIITDTFNRNINIIKEKTLGIIMEPSWSSYYNKNLYKMCKYVLFHDKNLYPHDNVIEWINSGFIHDIISHEMFTKKLPSNMNFNSYKYKSISFICGERNEFKEGYKLREDLTKYLKSKNLKVDVYGKYFIPDFDKNIYGQLQLKFNGLQNYKFSICIENSFEKNYVSEKLYDCLVNNVVPIYCGAPNIFEIFNEKNLIKFSNLNECISIIGKINSGKILYEDFIIKEASDKYFDDINLINQVLNIFKKYY